MAPSALIPRLVRALTTAANASGGWPYYAGKASRVEPTAWAVIALSGSEDDSTLRQGLLQPHLQWLERCQRSNGLLMDVDGVPPNLTATAVAACAVAHVRGNDAPMLPRLVKGLVEVRGVSVAGEPDPRQDNTLQGWPWMSGTFSWLEPTAWCVLALKKAAAGDAGARARIAEAEKVIVNRTCEAGGWNYGNASVIGQDLRPYVPTTAAALIAMQDRQNEPAIARSAAWLNRERLKEPSAMALSLAAIGLRIFGMPSTDVDAAIAADADRAERTGNLQGIAMMLFALTADRHDGKALRMDCR